MNDFQVIGTVGEGAHGIVLKAKHLPSGDFVALKKISLKKLSDGIPIQVVREIKALHHLEHINIVYLIDVFPQGLSFVLVLEFMPSNLWEILDAYELTGPQIKCYMTMLLNGLCYLHDNHILHRDLKPANLLIADNGALKIGDFGLCRLFFKGKKTAFSHQVATRFYRAPELLYGARYYDEGVDMWAAACILGEMLQGTPVFQGENDIDQLYKVISSLGTPTDSNWPNRKELPDYNKISFSYLETIPMDKLVASKVPNYAEYLSKILLYDSDKRLSAKQALEDPFMKNDPAPCSLEELPPLPTPSQKENNFSDFDSQYNYSDLTPATPSTLSENSE